MKALATYFSFLKYSIVLDRRTKRQELYDSDDPKRSWPHLDSTPVGLFTTEDAQVKVQNTLRQSERDVRSYSIPLFGLWPGPAEDSPQEETVRRELRPVLHVLATSSRRSNSAYRAAGKTSGGGASSSSPKDMSASKHGVPGESITLLSDIDAIETVMHAVFGHWQLWLQGGMYGRVRIDTIMREAEPDTQMNMLTENAFSDDSVIQFNSLLQLAVVESVRPSLKNCFISLNAFYQSEILSCKCVGRLVQRESAEGGRGIQESRFVSRRVHMICQSKWPSLPSPYHLPLDDLESVIWVLVWRIIFLEEEGIAPLSASAIPGTKLNDAERLKRNVRGVGKGKARRKCVSDEDEDKRSQEFKPEYGQDENEADDEGDDGEEEQTTPIPTREPLWWAGFHHPDPLVVFNTKVAIASFFVHHPRSPVPSKSARTSPTSTTLKITPHTKQFVPLIADLFSCINMCFDETRDLRDPETSALAAFNSPSDPDLASIDTRRAEILASTDKRAGTKRPKTPAEETLDAHMMVLYMRFVGHLWRHLELFKAMEAQAVERRRHGGMKRMDFGCESEESRE